jgi:hypothetical protein
MPIEAWIMAGICVALELFCIVMMFVLSWPRECVHGTPFRIPPPPRPKGGLKPNLMCPPPPPRGRYGIGVCPPAPLPYRHIEHVVIPNANIKPGIKPPKR